MKKSSRRFIAVVATVGAASSLLSSTVIASPPRPSKPKTIEVGAGPNGMTWDAASKSLFVADEDKSRIVVWRDGTAAPPPPIALPSTDKPGLGQVLKLADGTLVVARFGHGEGGGIVAIPPKGAARLVTGLNSKRRRIGLAPAPGGGVFSAWFEKVDDKEIGGVSLVTLAGGEKDLVTGMGKLVGLATSGDSLFLGDQSGSIIYRCPAKACVTPEKFAEVPGPDLLAPGPEGSLLATSRKGGVTLVCPNGKLQSVVTGDISTRGIAYDAKGDRIFVVEHGRGRSQVRVEAVHLGAHPCTAPH